LGIFFTRNEVQNAPHELPTGISTIRNILAARLLAADPEVKLSHFGDIMLTRKLLSPVFIYN
jgi:hypothetical protein